MPKELEGDPANRLSEVCWPKRLISCDGSGRPRERHCLRRRPPRDAQRPRRHRERKGLSGTRHRPQDHPGGRGAILRRSADERRTRRRRGDDRQLVTERCTMVAEGWVASPTRHVETNIHEVTMTSKPRIALISLGHRQRRAFAVRHTETTVSRSQRCAGSASNRGCHIAEITISGVRTGSSKL